MMVELYFHENNHKNKDLHMCYVFIMVFEMNLLIIMNLVYNKVGHTIQSKFCRLESRDLLLPLLLT